MKTYSLSYSLPRQCCEDICHLITLGSCPRPVTGITSDYTALAPQAGVTCDMPMLVPSRIFSNEKKLFTFRQDQSRPVLSLLFIVHLGALSNLTISVRKSISYIDQNQTWYWGRRIGQWTLMILMILLSVENGREQSWHLSVGRLVV